MSSANRGQDSQMSLVVKNLPANTGDVRDMGSIPGLGRSPGGGYGNPLQYSCLENPMDWGAWQATVHGSQRVRHDWSDLACMHAQRKLTAQGRQWSVQLWLLNLPSQPLWFAIPVFLLSFLALKLVFLVALLPKLFFLRLANSPSPDLVFILFLVTGSCIANCPYFSCLGYRPSAYISLSLNGCNSLTLLEIE